MAKKVKKVVKVEKKVIETKEEETDNFAIELAERVLINAKEILLTNKRIGRLVDAHCKSKTLKGI